MTAAALVAIALTVVPQTWLVERDGASTAGVTVTDRGMTFAFTIGSGPARAQFAALVTPVPGGLTAFSRVSFVAHASRPMRINVDLRPAGTHNPPRWRRSIYLDRTPRTVTVSFDDMRPIGGGSGPAPLASIGALMFVVDTNNTRPGTSGEVTLTAVALEP